MTDAQPKKYSIADVQKIYLETKAQIEAITARHAEEMKKPQERLDTCKMWMLNYLNQQGLDNAKTEHGMCYKSNVMSATVDNENDGWKHLLTHIFSRAIERALDYIENGGRDAEGAVAKFLEEPTLNLLNHSVNKTAVKEMMEQGASVPGVKIATVVNLNVRKS